MKYAAAKTTTPGEHKSASPLSGLTIAVQLLDTSWRVALPIVILTLIGVKLDHHYHHKIFFTLIAVFASLLISSALIYLQIRAVYPEFVKKKAK